MSRCGHCLVWLWLGSMVRISCYRCDYVQVTFPAREGDQERATASQQAHRRFCTKAHAAWSV